MIIFCICSLSQYVILLSQISSMDSNYGHNLLIFVVV